MLYLQGSRSKTGVCIVRVETQPESLLIAVSARRDVDSNLHSAFEERPRYFTEPDAALAVIVQFLYSFQGSDPAAHGSAGKPAGK
ncbi:hypothetical protein IV500_00605 [Paeniglutamicibacter antarcticus]|uniref:Uncharacterized protein n=1 Tax=Arthrobacter terrae TaxID=2935737 RepID=A0A931CNA4_9MICC|nr:hypothetical protein [Arthrobacter terrae]MBG0737941.1 hypothetical protein [Arthrobacter terrae]